MDVHQGDEVVASYTTDLEPQGERMGITVEILETLLTVRVKRESILSVGDHYFGGLGGVFLHTFGTRALFRNLKVFTYNTPE